MFGLSAITVFKVASSPLSVEYDWLGYNRIDWDGEFGRADPQRTNRKQGEIVNPLGCTTNRAELRRSNL